MRCSAEWCDVVQNAAFCRNVQALAALCGLFAYSVDLPQCRGVKVGIHGLLNWTAENLYLGLLLHLQDEGFFNPTLASAV
jgi:hypothetical protein